MSVARSIWDAGGIHDTSSPAAFGVICFCCVMHLVHISLSCALISEHFSTFSWGSFCITLPMKPLR